MDLAQQYDHLYQTTLRSVISHGFQPDERIGSPDDHRYGTTLRLRPQVEVQERMLDFVEAVRAVAPDQYFYPASDLHVTVLSIITCCEGFDLDEFDLASYSRLIAASLAGQEPFAVRFRGVTASPSCLMIQGFPEGDGLTMIRDRVRTAFRASTLHQTIDLRYETTLAHSTVVRFTSPMAEVTPVLDLLAAYRDHDFGLSQVDALELVASDWCHTQARTPVLARFGLGSGS